jgi:internalin A
MSELVQQLIAENRARYARGEDASMLDLGRSGLVYMPDISDMHWVKKLVIGGAVSDFFLSNLSTPTLTLHEGFAVGKDNDISTINEGYLPSNIIELHITNYSNRGKSFFDISFIKSLCKLEYILLSRMEIGSIELLSSLKSLKGIHFDSVGFRDCLPFTNLFNLEALLLNNIEIDDIEFIINLERLKVLSLTNCNLVNTDILSELVSLKRLSLANNHLNDITFLSTLINLEWLSLHNNNISDLTPLMSLGKLQKLDLSSNEIRDIRPIVFLLENGLSVSLDFFTSINNYTINLAENELSNPPIEIVQQGNKAILGFFEDIRKDGQDQIFEAKLIIIGEGGAGKTTLCRKLLNPEAPLPEEKNRTRGIDIHSLDFDIPNRNDRKFRLNIWDFAGQGKYQSAHSFFYTRRSLYILVDDTRTLNENDAYRTLYYNWLQTSELYGDKSPLVVLHNEKDNCSRIGFNLADFQARYSFLHYPHHRINLASAEIDGITNFREQIQLLALKLPHIGDTVPSTWVSIRRAIEDEKISKPYISAERFYAICSEAGVTSTEKQQGLSTYFHDLGIFLHFQGNPLLRRDIFLQNSWVTDAVYKIMDDYTIVEEKRGRFSKDDLMRVWNEKTYSDRLDELLELMLQFELCYNIQNTDTYVCPQLLPGGRPEFNYNMKPHIQLRYVYDFMPKGLFHRLIVRLHHHIANEQNQVWNCGIVLERKGAYAEILESLDRRVISIHVSGQYARDLTTIINEEIDRLHKPFGNRINVKVLIPCNCEECRISPEPYFFEKSSLEKRIDRKIIQAECGKHFVMINVYELLNGILSVSDEPAIITERKKKKVFISYSKNDSQQKDTLLKHLTGIRDHIIVWHDHDIRPGEEWNDAIQSALRDSDVVLYLVSHHSIATDYIQKVELPLVEELNKAGKCILIPVIIDFCVWNELKFAEKNALPDKGLPITDSRWTNENQAWVNIVEGIKRVLNYT